MNLLSTTALKSHVTDLHRRELLSQTDPGFVKLPKTSARGRKVPYPVSRYRAILCTTDWRLALRGHFQGAVTPSPGFSIPHLKKYIMMPAREEDTISGINLTLF